MIKHIIHGETIIQFADNDSYLIVDSKGNVTLYQDIGDEDCGGMEEERKIVECGIKLG